MARGRTRGEPQPPPRLEEILAAGVPREFALLAVRVGTLRCGRGWTYQQLADVAGLNNLQVRQLEAGRRDVTLSTMIKLRDVFELKSTGELLGEA